MTQLATAASRVGGHSRRRGRAGAPGERAGPLPVTDKDLYVSYVLRLTRPASSRPSRRPLSLVPTITEMAAVIVCGSVDGATGGWSARERRAKGRADRDRAHRPVRRFTPRLIYPTPGRIMTASARSGCLRAVGS